jgi:uncharacterized protein (DUF1499 family)
MKKSRYAFVGMLIGLLQVECAMSELSPCNGAWNCAITQKVKGQKPNAEPIYYTCSRKEAVIRLKKVVQSFPRSHVTAESNHSIKAQVTSKFFGFVDDLEFYMPKNKKVIHVRSAARTGIYDFGVNKKRIRAIKKLFDESLCKE